LHCARPARVAPDVLPVPKGNVRNLGEKFNPMNVSRRKFLRSGVVCALAASALLRSPVAALAQRGGDKSRDFQLPYEATTSPIFYFTRATFEPYVGGVFTAAGVGG